MKLYGVCIHNDIRSKKHSNKEIDITKTHLNYYIKKNKLSYVKEFDKLREKNNLKGGFEYIPKTKEYLGEYPDKETVAEVFNGAFNTQGDGFYDKPMLQFQEILETHFGLSMEELYALPIQ